MDDLNVRDDSRALIRDLEGRLERQGLVLRALFNLLKDNLGLTEEELLRHVHKSAPPGGIYGKVIPPRRPCSTCGRNMGQRRNRCLFCGVEWEAASAFEYLEIGGALDPKAPGENGDWSVDDIRLETGVRPDPDQDTDPNKRSSEAFRASPRPTE